MDEAHKIANRKVRNAGRNYNGGIWKTKGSNSGRRVCRTAKRGSKAKALRLTKEEN